MDDDADDYTIASRREIDPLNAILNLIALYVTRICKMNVDEHDTPNWSRHLLPSDTEMYFTRRFNNNHDRYRAMMMMLMISLLDSASTLSSAPAVSFWAVLRVSAVIYPADITCGWKLLYFMLIKYKVQ